MEPSASAIAGAATRLPLESGDAANDRRGTGGGGGAWRVLLVAVVMLAAVLVIHLTPVRAWLTDAQRLRATLLGLGIWVYPVAVLAVAVLLGCGVPRLPIHAAGGMIFGFGIGLALTLVGALVGHYCVFLFIRWGGREWVLNRWPKLRKWADLVHEQGIVAVILARQLPAHAMLINACLALSNVKHRHFLVGTAAGLIPEAVPATLVGAGLVKASLRSSAGYLGLGAAVLALIWIGGGYAVRAMQKNKESKTSG